MAETTQRLNTLGNVNQLQGQQRQQKSSSKYGGAQVINGYGHNGSGKLYSYYGTNKRTCVPVIERIAKEIIRILKN